MIWQAYKKLIFVKFVHLLLYIFIKLSSLFNFKQKPNIKS